MYLLFTMYRTLSEREMPPAEFFRAEAGWIAAAPDEKIRNYSEPIAKVVLNEKNVSL